MTLEFYCLLFDFGLLVLIWLTQLIVYPSFRYSSATHFVAWHNTYTNRISVIVIPLMSGQLILSGLQLWALPSIGSSIAMVAILGAWAITFIFFVPLHNTISANRYTDDTLVRLVRLNWWRTGLWTFVFLLHLLYWPWQG